MTSKEKKKKNAENMRNWRKKNPEKVRESNAKNHKKYQEKILAHKKMLYDNDPLTYQERSLKWYYNHRDKQKAQRIAKYGLSLIEYNQLLENTKICPICNDSFNKNPPVVDHDHISGKIRGIICRMCNSGLGFFRENIDLLLNAIEYLRKGGI